MTGKSLDSNVNLWSYVVLKGFEALRREEKKPEEKRKLLKDVYAKFRLIPDGVKEHLKAVEEALLSNGYRVKVCKVKALGRVLVGAGEPFGRVPFEVGMFFDPVLNVPFIPGSSIKGALRSAFRELSGNKDLEEDIFGGEKWSGLLGVTDAYPVKEGEGGALFEPDVVTPHYPDAKTEVDVSPNPVVFLTVARGVEFQFYVYFDKPTYAVEGDRKVRRVAALGSRRDLVHLGSQDELAAMQPNVVPLVDRAVLYAFARGVGAKTAVGYSVFSVVEYRVV